MASGDLAGTPLGECVGHAIEEAARSVDAPGKWDRPLQVPLTFPFDPVAAELRLARSRQTIQERVAVPPI